MTISLVQRWLSRKVEAATLVKRGGHDLGVRHNIPCYSNGRDEGISDHQSWKNSICRVDYEKGNWRLCVEGPTYSPCIASTITRRPVKAYLSCCAFFYAERTPGESCRFAVQMRCVTSTMFFLDDGSLWSVGPGASALHCLKVSE